MRFTEGALAIEEISKVHTSWRLPINLQCWGSVWPIQILGTEEQKKNFVPKFVSGEYIGSFAMTEPDVGSDVAAMKCYAEDTGDHFIINGSKVWITNGSVCDYGLLYVKTDRNAGAKGITCMIMDYGLPGITRKPIKDKVGSWASDTAEITFEDVRLPKELVLGGINNGFRVCMTQLNHTRLGCAAGALGLTAACLDASVKFANQKCQFGNTIGRHQLVQQQIAEMKMEHEALAALVYKAAWLKDLGMPSQLETSIAKLFGAKAVVHTVNECMKLFGSSGYSNEYPCGRFLRDSKLFETIEGTSNMHTMIIANTVFGYSPNH